MTIYAHYAADEQLLLRHSLQAAAVAIPAASPGRKEETASEGFAAASFILASGPDRVRDTLVTSVIEELQRRASENELLPDYEKVASAQVALDDAKVTLRAAAGLLDAKATPDEDEPSRGALRRCGSSARQPRPRRHHVPWCRHSLRR